MTSGTPAQLHVADGHYPGFRELVGLPFKVSVVMSATDISFGQSLEREEALQRLALCWNSHAALAHRVEQLEAALREAIATIKDYVAYEHDGDPWTEDARAMGEMDINDFVLDGRLARAEALLSGVSP